MFKNDENHAPTPQVPQFQQKGFFSWKQIRNGGRRLMF
jgi:hypothetical protein